MCLAPEVYNSLWYFFKIDIINNTTLQEQISKIIIKIG